LNEELLRLWGKTKPGSKEPEEFHPAVFHMLDVGNVARVLLNMDTSLRWRNTLAREFASEGKNLSNWLPYFVALHDIGKVSAAFQAQNKQQLTRLRYEGFELSPIDIPHSYISQICMEDTLPQEFKISSTKTQIFSESLGGHHGRFAHPDNDIKSGRRKLSDESEQWKSLRKIVDSILKDEFLKIDPNLLPDPENISTAIMAFTGFTIFCDWLGSDERYFKISPKIALPLYKEKSRQQAEQIIQVSGINEKTLSFASTKTEKLFADLLPLRALQLAIDDIPEDLLQYPSLTIIEAPTGEGKTEAALALAHRIAQINNTEELYYALPSMATSNQMFGRLKDHLEKRLGLTANVKLVHGQAYLIEEDLQTVTSITSIQPLENGETKNDTDAQEVISWFNSKKRALIAPFGVGTVDQAELATLNVKHAALRMMGLVGKVVIIDEVHAYDTYMTTIIERLLGWLSSMNTSVILLSATLPKKRRLRLAQAYSMKHVLSEAQSNAYPSLLVLNEKNFYQASPAVWQTNRIIELQELHLGDDNPQEKAQWLLDMVSRGGYACWITNTVKRAQRISQVLNNIAPPDVDLELLHSQIPLDERQQRENHLKNKYGRDGKRPDSGKGIVVGTQVLEQSLDLDFDVMVSDLAPIDLLLQRAGRLHRHARLRPSNHTTPKLWLNFETDENGELKLGTDRTVYAEFIMRQTHKTLTEYSQIQLPEDYRNLIEAVYGDIVPLEDSLLYDAWLKLQSDQKIASQEARERLLPTPNPRDSFARTAAMRIKFEEDENSADWIVAKTRLSEYTLNIIPLERNGDSIILESTSERIAIRIHTEAPREIQRKLLCRQLRISNQIAIDEIMNDVEKNPTELFDQSALLKGFYPLWLKGGEKEFKTKHGLLRIILDPQLGLVIEKEKIQ
jgi:CRISPR-associated endonuclease/helicase Cas3